MSTFREMAAPLSRLLNSTGSVSYLAKGKAARRRAGLKGTSEL